MLYFVFIYFRMGVNGGDFDVQTTESVYLARPTFLIPRFSCWNVPHDVDKHRFLQVGEGSFRWVRDINEVQSRA